MQGGGHDGPKKPVPPMQLQPNDSVTHPIAVPMQTQKLHGSNTAGPKSGQPRRQPGMGEPLKDKRERERQQIQGDGSSQQQQGGGSSPQHDGQKTDPRHPAKQADA
jgi:hypothetical protein